MNSFEMPTNETFEKMLEENIKKTKPLTMKKKETPNGEKLFPFWTPVYNYEAEEKYDDFLTKKDKDLNSMQLNNNVGIVKSKSTFASSGKNVKNTNKKYYDDSIIGLTQRVIDAINNKKLTDNTQIVKPKAEFTVTVNDGKKVTTKTVEIGTPSIPKMPKNSINIDNTNPIKTISNASTNKGDHVGSVKPKAEFKTKVTDKNGNTTTKITELGKAIIPGKNEKAIDALNATVKTETKLNIKDFSKEKTVLNNKTGTVKPKAEFHEKGKEKKVINTVVKTETKIPKQKEKTVLNDKVGIVKPKAEFHTKKK